MKNLIKPILVLSISSILLTSCAKDETTTPTGPTYKNLVTYEAKILGGQTNSTLGSFYSISEDSVYFKAGADLNPAKIDFIYYFGLNSGDSSVITAPSDPVFNLPSDQTPFTSVKNWTKKNNTTFLKLDLSSNVFAAMTNDTILTSRLDSNFIATKITKLKIGDVVGFKTDAGKLGAYQVKAINNTNAIVRSITIDVKVQE